jgi:1,4-alpha-glucan branching enzyme
LLTDLNNLYKNEQALYRFNYNQIGFEWIESNDLKNCVFSWIRKSDNPAEGLIFVANMTPAVIENYRIGVPQMGFL